MSEDASCEVEELQHYRVASGAPLADSLSNNSALSSSLVHCVRPSLEGGAPKIELASGWRATRHRPTKAAQSGYRGDDGKLYCKVCLREEFPDRYAEKQSSRKRVCKFCQGTRRLPGDFCKPCRLVRSCPKCSAMNGDLLATVCSACPDPCLVNGAQRRLAAWCLACLSADAQASGLCPRCFSQAQEAWCDHCSGPVWKGSRGK